MKKLLIFLILAIGLKSFSQQATVKGRLISATTGDPIVNATVTLIGDNNAFLTTYSDIQGYFIFEMVQSANYQLFINASGFEDYFSEQKINVAGGEIDLGDILLNPKIGGQTDEIPIVEQEELESEQGENISSMLHGSRDIFLSTAAFNLGQFRFRIRGYENKYNEVDINGVPMNNMESGLVFWSNWGGLNNVTRYKNTLLGLDFADFSFGNISGETNITMQPSTFRPGTRITFSQTNRTYRQRLMFTYSTGLMSNNWAITVSGSRRWANEGYVPGTFYDAWGYYLGIEKKTNKHNFILNIFGVPYKRGKQGATVQEAYDLTGSHYYNPYWGYQNGKKRNSRIANYHKPTAIFTDIFKINDNTKLTTSFAARVGRAGSTALNWYNAPDPRPDYYRYLPSYITNEYSAQIVADSFQSPEYSQINWAEIYDANRNSYDIVYDANGIKGNTVEGKRAQYILEERRYDQRYFAFVSYLNKQFNDYLSFDGGVQLRYFKGLNYKKIVDLLGADFWLDIDKYAERDIADPDSAQSDLNNPNRIVKEGDIFGYNYQANIRDGKLWTQFTIDKGRFTFNIGTYLLYTMFWRTGLMRNGKFPDNSYGDSEKQKFFDMGAKTNLILKINGRNYLFAHAATMTLPPSFRNAYISPRTRDFVVDNLQSEHISSVDFGYSLRSPRVKATIDFFYTTFKNQTKVVSFYHDGYRNYVNYVMTGIDKLHQGVELALEAEVFAGFNMYFVGSKGFYQYSSRPKVTITIDNSAEVLAQNKTVYIQNYFVPGTPQTAASVGIKYRAPKFWFFNVNANYFDDLYLDFNPERRTIDAVAYITDSTRLHQITDQIKLPSGFTLDASIGKSFRIQHKYYIFINFSVNNILNDQDIITGGYEQLRFDMKTQDPDKFPPKYFYLYGRQYFFNLIFSF